MGDTWLWTTLLVVALAAVGVASSLKDGKRALPPPESNAKFRAIAAVLRPATSAAKTPPSVVAKYGSGTCPGCGNRIQIGGPITLLEGEGWGHSACVQRWYLEQGSGDVADHIRANVNRMVSAYNPARIVDAPSQHEPASHLCQPQGWDVARDPCSLCGESMVRGEVLTDHGRGKSAHSDCAAKHYDEQGAHDVAAMIRSDARLLRHPPSIICDWDEQCQLCHRYVADGAVVTFYFAMLEWVHPGCLWQLYERDGLPEIGAKIRIDADVLRRRR